MSSETSTDAQTLSSPPTATSGDAGFQPWQLFTLAGLISAAVVAFFAGARPPSVRVALILVVFAAAAVGIAALRALLPLTGHHRSEVSPVLGGRTRAALWREKMLALRSIKELEFDRAMGKVSEKDFAEMSGRLRARATRILRQLDAEGYRAEIEREIERRLGGERPSVRQPGADAVPPAAVVGRTGPEADTAPALTVQTIGRACGACSTTNDPDARFCKECGARLEAS